MRLETDRDVTEYLINSMHLEIGDCYFQRFDTKTQLIIELFGKVTARQIRKIEASTATQLDSIMLTYNVIENSTHADLVFIR